MLQASRLVLIDALLDKGDNLFRTLFWFSLDQYFLRCRQKYRFHFIRYR